MKKNLTISRLIVWLLAVTFMINTPAPMYSMARIKTKLMDIKKKNAITRLVRAFKDTRELRRKKAAGTATPAELKELDRRMSKIKKGAIAVGVTLAIIAAIAGGTLALRYRSQKKAEEKEKEIQEMSLIDVLNTKRNNPQYFETENITEIIQSKKDQINTPDQYGNTPLHHATKYNDLGSITVLMQLGADPTIKNKRDKIAFDFVNDSIKNDLITISPAYQEYVKMKTEKKGVEILIPEFEKIRKQAEKSLKKAEIQVILKKIKTMTDPDEIKNKIIEIGPFADSNIRKALHKQWVKYASNAQIEESIKNAIDTEEQEFNLNLLLDYGVDLNNFKHLAFYVCMHGNSSLMLTFLRKIKEPNSIRDENNNTIWHCIAKLGADYADAIKYYGCSKNNSQINAQNNEGNTPLHIAAQKSKYHIVLTLLNDCNANANIRNNAGKKALDLASDSGVIEILKKVTRIEKWRPTVDDIGRMPTEALLTLAKNIVEKKVENPYIEIDNQELYQLAEKVVQLRESGLIDPITEAKIEQLSPEDKEMLVLYIKLVLLISLVEKVLLEKTAKKQKIKLYA